MLAEDAVSMAYFDEKWIVMSGKNIGRYAIAEGLYGNLATGHHDGPGIAAVIKLMAQRETEMARGA